MKEEWVKERNRRFDNGSTRTGNKKKKQQEVIDKEDNDSSYKMFGE